MWVCRGGEKEKRKSHEIKRGKGEMKREGNEGCRSNCGITRDSSASLFCVLVFVTLLSSTREVINM